MVVGVSMLRTLTLTVLVSIILVSAMNTSHAAPRISALVPRANDDIAHNTHGWALQRDSDRIVLMSPAKISLLARVEGKLRETDAQFEPNGVSYFAIGKRWPSGSSYL